MAETPAIRVKKYLKGNGITQTFLAKKSGINIKTLNGILNGKIKLSADNTELICGALGCDPNVFLQPQKKVAV